MKLDVNLLLKKSRNFFYSLMASQLKKEDTRKKKLPGVELSTSHRALCNATLLFN